MDQILDPCIGERVVAVRGMINAVIPVGTSGLAVPLCGDLQHHHPWLQDAATQEAGQLRVTLADLNGHIRTRSDDAVEEAWREAREKLEVAEERVGRFEIEKAVLDRLRTTLGAARSAARDLYLKPVMSELRPLLRLLFDDISIVFHEKTLLPQTVRRNGQDEDVERLSGGMREQLSVLTRLAFARLLARDGRPTPVILDDALVYSDDDRMFDALHRQYAISRFSYSPAANARSQNSAETFCR